MPSRLHDSELPPVSSSHPLAGGVTWRLRVSRTRSGCGVAAPGRRKTACLDAAANGFNGPGHVAQRLRVAAGEQLEFAGLASRNSTSAQSPWFCRMHPTGA